MTYEKLKRNRYFFPPYEFPHTSRNHWEDQNELILPHSRMHSAHAHEWGILDGLEVNGAVASTTLTIAPGAAIDGDGNLISLTDSGQADIGVDPGNSQSNPVGVPVTLPLAPITSQKMYVTISHHEITRDLEGSGGRDEVVPWIRLQPTSGANAYSDDGASIILAIVDIDGMGRVSTLTARDGALQYKRRLAGVPVEYLTVRRPNKNGNDIEQVDSARIGPDPDGGLEITVPTNSDPVRILCADGGALGDFDVKAHHVIARDNQGRPVMNLHTGLAELTVGTQGNEGDLQVKDVSDRKVFHMDGAGALLRIGAQGNAGDLEVRDQGGNAALGFYGSSAWLRVGSTGNEGDIEVKDSNNRAALHFDGGSAWLRVGTTDNEGDIEVKDGENRQVFHFNGQNAWLKLGARDNEGDIEIVDSEGRSAFHLDGNSAYLRAGTERNAGDISVRNTGGNETIWLEGATGRIRSNGAILGANPTRHIRYVHLGADSGTSTKTVDLGSERRFLAFVAQTGMDPRHDHDTGDAFALDVYKIDGEMTGWTRKGGDHFGPENAYTNIRRQAIRSTGREIQFRARSFQDATVFGIGIVIYE